MSDPAITSDPKRAPAAVEAMDSAVLRLIPEFDGDSAVSISEWLEKVELVCSLRGVTALESVIPLRLTGGAFAVYQQLPSSDKKDTSKMKEALTAAFGIDAFSAYERFASRRIQPGESVDVFLAALRKLTNCFGGLPDKALACAFVAGLPESTRQTLRANSRLEALTLQQLVARARIVMAEDSNFVCAGHGKHRTEGRPRDATPVCSECQAPNHHAKDCLLRRQTTRRDERRRNSDGLRNPRRRGPCFRCGEYGHLVATCPGNGDGAKESAPAFSPERR